MSTGQDSDLHPLQSRQVPLPLDHLQSKLSPCFNSYPRALNAQSMTLTSLNIHCYASKYLGSIHACALLISETMHMDKCFDGTAIMSKHMFLKLFIFMK